MNGNIYGSFLGDAVKNGSVPEALLDDKLVRCGLSCSTLFPLSGLTHTLYSILTPYFALNQASLPSIDFNRYAASKDSASVARKIAEESITLLKNSNETGRGLPLNKPQDLIRT